MALCLISLIALNLGSVSISLFSFTQNDLQILLEARAPRILMAILIGSLLASSGVVIQSVFANPIADPYIIGIASSATLGAVIAYMLGLNDAFFGVMGFIFCAVFTLLIFSISKGIGITTLLIIGIALSAFIGSFSTFYIYLIGEDSFRIVAWLMGDLGGSNWNRIFLLCIPLVLSIALFYYHRETLNILLSGDDEARSLGVDTLKIKKQLLIVASLSVGFCVGFSGIIGFVGLIVPHIIRIALGSSNHQFLLPLSFLVGGLFLLICDTLGRTIIAPTQIPIGVITAFIGSPIFLYLALKRGH
ncbi:iron ABC transporter [Helicobacter monodelphidis]|nr:iron ABC transporter [Helicobacter sp. 15-1451]